MLDEARCNGNYKSYQQLESCNVVSVRIYKTALESVSVKQDRTWRYTMPHVMRRARELPDSAPPDKLPHSLQVKLCFDVKKETVEVTFGRRGLVKYFDWTQLLSHMLQLVVLTLQGTTSCIRFIKHLFDFSKLYRANGGQIDKRRQNQKYSNYKNTMNNDDRRWKLLTTTIPSHFNK